MACVAYPVEEFPRKVAFRGAGFFVRAIEDATTSDACLAGDPNWLVGERGEVVVDNLPAARFSVSDNWTSNYLRGEYYRVFVKGRCFHLALQRHYVSTGLFDPGTYDEFTEEDDERVKLRLQLVLLSLHFQR